jgi:cation transport ATPase
MADDSEGVMGVDGSGAGTERTTPMDDVGGTTASTVPAARVQALAEGARRQRTMVIVAAGLAAVAFLVGGSLGYWPAGLFVAVGIGLALVNTVVTEMSMMRMTASGDDLSRRQFAMGALVRLAAISLVAFVLVVVFWRVGGGFVLAGLAVFQLLTVALTGFPLLKELRNS